MLPCSLEEKIVSYGVMLKRTLFGLTTSSINRMAFERAIKMVLPIHFQYNKEQQAGSGCLSFCVAILD